MTYCQPLPDLLTEPDMEISCPHFAGEAVWFGGVAGQAVVTQVL